MTRVSVSELKARLSAFLEIVRSGEEVLVTDRGRPVARLVPLGSDANEEGRRDMLLRTGRLRAPSGTLAADFLSRPRPGDAEGHSLAAIIRERAEGW